MRFRRIAFPRLLCLAFVVLPLGVVAQDYTASVAQMPVYSESLDKGVLIDLIKAMATESGKNITIELVPFSRAMDAVNSARVNFHMPLIKNPTLDDNTLPYLHSTETIFHVNFTLYTNKDHPIDKNKLTAYNIETDAAHVIYFPFKTIASYSLENSLRKLAAGRIDAFIFADTATDPLIAKLELTNIKRELYQRFDVKIILPRDNNFEKTNAFISATLKKLRASGKFDKIMSIIDKPFSP